MSIVFEYCFTSSNDLNKTATIISSISDNGYPLSNTGFKTQNWISYLMTAIRRSITNFRRTNTISRVDINGKTISELLDAVVRFKMYRVIRKTSRTIRNSLFQ